MNTALEWNKVLRKLSENNVTLKLDKSKFIENKVKFLGFNLTEMGISPSQEKVEAIQQFPTPKNSYNLFLEFIIIIGNSKITIQN